VDNALSITDNRGNTTDHEDDALNRVDKITAPEAGTHSREVSNVYDASDNLLQTTDKRGIVTSYQYDRLNRVEEQQRSGIRVVKNTYSEIGDLVGLEDANGNVTAMEFNQRHEMV
jgi:YD repeat-containing protein